MTGRAGARDVIRDERGLSILENAIAMLIASIVVAGLAGVLVSGFRATRDNRVAQQGMQLASETLERARDHTWEELAITPEVADDDPRLVASGRLLDGSAFGFPEDEPLVEESGHPQAAIVYLQSETLDGTDFTIYTYATEPEPGLRRILAWVEWTSGGRTAHQQASTVISQVSAP